MPPIALQRHKAQQPIVTSTQRTTSTSRFVQLKVALIIHMLQYAALQGLAQHTHLTLIRKYTCNRLLKHSGRELPNTCIPIHSSQLYCEETHGVFILASNDVTSCRSNLFFFFAHHVIIIDDYKTDVISSTHTNDVHVHVTWACYDWSSTA